MVTPRRQSRTVDNVYDHELAALQSSVLVQMDESQRALFVTATKVWAKYRDANCRSEASVYGEGTLAPVAEVACRMEVTRDRITQIRAGYKDLLDDGK